MSAQQFLTEPPPPRGVALPVAPGIRRLVAHNPGPMTYHGTNTYLLDGNGGITVVDPGPDDAAHVAAVMAQAGRRIARILLTHAHRDHAGALPALARATGASVHRFIEGLGDGGAVDGWTALHTPGHAPDHLCFARADGVMLTGDHVMSFSTSVVIPPDGSMSAYMNGLRRLLERNDSLYLPGHGPPIDQPRQFTEALLAHRLARAAAILGQLRAGQTAPDAIVTALYAGLNPSLRGAAQASVLAHLLMLAAEGLASETDGMWRAL